MALEYAPTIRFNCVAPAVGNTSMYVHRIPLVPSDNLRAQAASKYWQRSGLKGTATENRGYAADETSRSANGHSKCSVVSGIRPELVRDWNHPGGRRRARGLGNHTGNVVSEYRIFTPTSKENQESLIA